MPYVELESHLPVDLNGRIICRATKGPFSHSAFVSKGFRYEALISKGYVKDPWYWRPGVVVTRVPLTDEEYGKFMTSAESMVGTKYPNPGYLALEYLFPPLRDLRRRVYCSQAIMIHAKAAGLYSAPIDLPKAPRPHPSIPFVLFETLANERAKRTLSVT